MLVSIRKENSIFTIYQEEATEAAEESFRSDLEHGPKIKSDHGLVYYTSMISSILSPRTFLFSLSLFFVQD